MDEDLAALLLDGDQVLAVYFLPALELGQLPLQSGLELGPLSSILVQHVLQVLEHALLGDIIHCVTADQGAIGHGLMLVRILLICYSVDDLLLRNRRLAPILHQYPL